MEISVTCFNLGKENKETLSVFTGLVQGVMDDT